MKTEVKSLFSLVRESQIKVLSDVIKLERLPIMDSADAADTAYALREISESLDASRKACDRLRKVCESKACLFFAMENNGEQIETEYCFAVPEITQIPKFPAKRRYNPSQFDEVLQGFLGVPKETCEKELVRPNYPAFVEYFNECLLNGRPVPGIDLGQTLTEARLRIRKRKDIG